MGDFSYGVAVFDMLNIFFQQRFAPCRLHSTERNYRPDSSRNDGYRVAVRDPKLVPGAGKLSLQQHAARRKRVYRARTYRSRKEAKKQFEGFAEEQRQATSNSRT